MRRGFFAESRHRPRNLVGLVADAPEHGAHAVGDESDLVLETKYHAANAFTLVQPDGSYRALVFKLPKASEADSDYRVVAYRRQGNTYVRHGAELNLVNFERPRLNVGGPGTPPRIETTENHLGVRYHIALNQKGADLVPSEGLMDGGTLVGHPKKP